MLYDNGEPILKTRMEDEDWYGYYQNLIELSIAPEFTFSTIEDPSRLVALFNQEWAGLKGHKNHRESFPSDEQVLRWSVLLTERHNNVYNCPQIIKAFREEYGDLKNTLKNWTDWDVAMLEIALLERKTGFKEFFKDVKVNGGLPENKYWIYDNSNILSAHIVARLKGLTSFGVLELNDEEAQWRWVPVEGE